MQPLNNLTCLLCFNRPYHFKSFKGCIPQILLGPFLKTLVHIKHFGWLKSHIASTYPYYEEKFWWIFGEMDRGKQDGCTYLSFRKSFARYNYSQKETRASVKQNKTNSKFISSHFLILIIQKLFFCRKLAEIAWSNDFLPNVSKWKLVNTSTFGKYFGLGQYFLKFDGSLTSR